MTVDTSKPTDSMPGRGGFSLDIERRGIRSGITGYFDRLRSGDPGALPSVLGIVVLGIIFSQLSGDFLHKDNLGNVPGQGAYIAILALGLIFVLLLGEIDLSGGTTGGMCAGFAVEALIGKGGLHNGVQAGLYWPLVAAMIAIAGLGFYLKSISGPIVVLIGVVLTLFHADNHQVTAMILAVSVGAAVGIFIGWLVAVVRIPSFVVTLGLFLAFQGVLQFALQGESQKVNDDNLINGLANDNLSPAWSWVFTIVLVAGYVAYTAIRSILSQRKGLTADTLSLVFVRGGIIAAGGLVLTYLANENRNPLAFGTPAEGIPYAAAVPLALMVVCTIALTNTTWGRHLFATGGNAEAARRAGIDVTHIRVTAFTISSSFAALAGLFLASLNGAVTKDLGGANALLFSVAAAVIGGTSLFGGRGRPRDALLGGLVVVIIPNGVELRPDLGAQFQYVVTGAVLLVAAGIDAMARNSTWPKLPPWLVRILSTIVRPLLPVLRPVGNLFAPLVRFVVGSG